MTVRASPESVTSYLEFSVGLLFSQERRLDMRMPIMDGYEATEKIRKNESMKGITIVGVSAHAGDEEINKAIAAGCDHYLTKPIDFKKLSEIFSKNEEKIA